MDGPSTIHIQAALPRFSGWKRRGVCGEMKLRGLVGEGLGEGWERLDVIKVYGIYIYIKQN